MAFTADQLSALETAIAQGTTIVWYQGQKIEYRSLADMLRLRDLMQREVGTSAAPRVSYVSFSRGAGA